MTEKYLLNTLLASIILLVVTVILSLSLSFYKIDRVEQRVNEIDRKVDTIVTALSGVIDTRIEEK